MPPKKPSDVLMPAAVEGRLLLLRGQRVMLDSDLAELYGITTAALNQAVDRNPERFPDDFAFQLTRGEFTTLISQTVISKTGRGGRQKLPRVFTEHGVAMLSSVLRSETAVRVNIEIMRAFVRLRRVFAAPGEFVAQLEQLAETVKLHDDQIRAIGDVLRRMLEPPPEPPRRRVGFHVPEPPPAAEAGK